jgi:hypothetical protein
VTELSVKISTWGEGSKPLRNSGLKISVMKGMACGQSYTWAYTKE